jgi:hypothetical protein
MSSVMLMCGVVVIGGSFVLVVSFRRAMSDMNGTNRDGGLFCHVGGFCD